MPEAHAMEAECWFRCDSAEALHRFGVWYDEEYAPDGARGMTEPEPHRRFLIIRWPHVPHDDDTGEPWQDTFTNGVGQAALLQERAGRAGHEVTVYAVRVQALDAEFPADSTPAVTPASDSKVTR